MSLDKRVHHVSNNLRHMSARQLTENGPVSEATMSPKSSPQPAVLHEAVFEARYNYGYTYLDRCGITLNDLLQDNIGWSVDGANPQTGVMRNPEKAAGFSFGSKKLDMNFKQSPDRLLLPDMTEIASFSAQIPMTVLDHLAIEEVTRIGFRTWQLFGYDKLAEAQEAAKALRFVTSDRIAELGLGDVEEVSFSFVAERGDYAVRVAIAPVQQQVRLDLGTIKQALLEPRKMARGQRAALLSKLRAKKAKKTIPAFSVLLDVDTYCEYPAQLNDTMISEYIIECDKWCSNLGKELFFA